MLARNAAELALLKLANPSVAAAASPIALKHIDEKGIRYIDYLMPGMLGMNLMGGGLWGVGFVVVHLRTRKLLKRFLATPMRRSDFLLSAAGFNPAKIKKKKLGVSTRLDPQLFLCAVEVTTW